MLQVQKCHGSLTEGEVCLALQCSMTQIRSCRLAENLLSITADCFVVRRYEDFGQCQESVTCWPLHFDGEELPKVESRGLLVDA